MSIFHPDFYQPGYSMITVAPHWYTYWKSNGHFTAPIYSHTQRPVTVLTQNIWSSQDIDEHIEYHHFYGLNQRVPLSPIWYYQQSTLLSLPNSTPKTPPRLSHHEGLSEAWPEGFTLRGELRWGKLQRVFGANRELPDFVKQDLRRVYGTYPSTAVSIRYQNGEFLVRGNPRVGEQEYRVERKVVRKEATPPEGDSVSEIIQKKRKGVK